MGQKNFEVAIESIYIGLTFVQGSIIWSPISIYENLE